jgi:hypothetical protein
MHLNVEAIDKDAVKIKGLQISRKKNREEYADRALLTLYPYTSPKINK